MKQQMRERKGNSRLKFLWKHCVGPYCLTGEAMFSVLGLQSVEELPGTDSWGDIRGSHDGGLRRMWCLAWRLLPSTGQEGLGELSSPYTLWCPVGG